MKRGSFHPATRLLGFAALLATGPLACERRAAEDQDLRWLSLEIDRPEVEPLAAEAPGQPLPDEDGMITFVFQVPRSFMTFVFGPRTPRPSNDPFATIAPPRLRAAQEELEKTGVRFAPGSFARYDPASSSLVVRQTPEEMDLVEYYFGHWRSIP